MRQNLYKQCAILASACHQWTRQLPSPQTVTVTFPGLRHTAARSCQATPYCLLRRADDPMALGAAHSQAAFMSGFVAVLLTASGTLIGISQLTRPLGVTQTDENLVLFGATLGFFFLVRTFIVEIERALKVHFLLEFSRVSTLKRPFQRSSATSTLTDRQPAQDGKRLSVLPPHRRF